MKKLNLKSFFCGMLTMAMLSTAVAFAAPVLTNLEAYTGSIKKIMINGVDKTPNTTTNPDLQPFIYNDRTYVPLRYIAENLYKNVGWDGTAGIITIDGLKVPATEENAIKAAVLLNITHMQNEDLNSYLSDLSVRLDPALVENTRNSLAYIFDNFTLSTNLISSEIAAYDGTNADVRTVTEVRKVNGEYSFTNNRTTSIIKLVKESGKWRISYSYIEKYEALQ